MSSRVVFDVSGHGYGHLAQAAPVIARLLEHPRAPRVVLRTRVDPRVVHGRLGREVEIIDHEVDVGMIMASPNAVRREASHRAHLAFHARWADSVARDAEALRGLGASLLVSNVGYRGLAAAAAAAIPALAFSSLDWARIYGHYCAHLPGARRVLGEMRAAYATAETFLSLEPGLGRHGMGRIERVGPIGQRGRPDREALAARAGARDGEAMILVSPGGIGSRLDLRRWPRAPSIRWIAPAALARGAPGTAALEDIDWPHVDVLASADAVVTKPGYGTFVDAACNSRPVVFAERPDWPEEPRLGRWLAARVPTARVSWGELVRGRIGNAVAAVLAARSGMTLEPAEPHGVETVAAAITALLG